jgi:hypothetical protein
MSRPLGAMVELDGGYIGKTPLVMKHVLTKREYDVRILLDGYKPWTQKVFIDPSTGSMNVMAVLESAAP